MTPKQFDDGEHKFRRFLSRCSEYQVSRLEGACREMLKNWDVRRNLKDKIATYHDEIALLERQLSGVPGSDDTTTITASVRVNPSAAKTNNKRYLVYKRLKEAGALVATKPWTTALRVYKDANPNQYMELMEE